MLVLPFRRTHDVALSKAIEQYISTKYDQHPHMFARDLETIDELRKAAAHTLEAHTSGIRKLQVYTAQLVWIGGKFPIDVGIWIDLILASKLTSSCPQIGIDFIWYPALGYNTQRPSALAAILSGRNKFNNL